MAFAMILIDEREDTDGLDFSVRFSGDENSLARNVALSMLDHVTTIAKPDPIIQVPE